MKDCIFNKRLYKSIGGAKSLLRSICGSTVNLDFVVKYHKGEGGTPELADGKEIEVSAGKKNVVLKKLFS